MGDCPVLSALLEKRRKEKKRTDYAFRRQFNEKPSITPGCPGKSKIMSILPHVTDLGTAAIHD